MSRSVVPPSVQEAILTWYDATGRSLPFRGTRDPYAILVSEVMAQQTQIGRVALKWSSFLATFPTVASLAAAPTADVLRAWRGLGYNRRAVNLQRAARVIVATHDGRVPEELPALESLPGVGPYTARAVAVLAFGRAVGPVDTNVRRVLGRLQAGGRRPTHRELQSIADAAVPPDRPADWTHALMDLGATICRPAVPLCTDCPARPWCRYAGSGGAARSGRPVERRPAFSSTRRWLRGRILDSLRDVPRDEWAAFVGPLGAHDDVAIREALAAMQKEGLIERHRMDPGRARLAS
jgi:A/G-specific adenine glycosylase